MIVQFVKFETTLGQDEAMAIAAERASEFRAIPGLVQKFYLKLDKPNHFGGFYIWENREAMMAFRQTDLFRSIPGAYRVIGAPEVEIHELMCALRGDAAIPGLRELA